MVREQDYLAPHWGLGGIDVHRPRTRSFSQTVGHIEAEGTRNARTFVLLYRTITNPKAKAQASTAVPAMETTFIARLVSPRFADCPVIIARFAFFPTVCKRGDPRESTAVRSKSVPGAPARCSP